MHPLTLCTLGALIILMIYWLRASIEEEDEWSIGIYRGQSPLLLAPYTASSDGLVIRAADVTDVNASFVADPFLVRQQGHWVLFFELYNVDRKCGEIAYATSENGTEWQYQKRVLAQPFHLSYPQVFEAENEYYMIPETAEADSVRLYKAKRFPDEWEFVMQLLPGSFLDPSIVFFEQMWWLFALKSGTDLTLHHSEKITGPWIAHAQSPVLKNSPQSRPGGRIIRTGDRLLRYSQNGESTYGHHVTASEILELSISSFRERPAALTPVIGATGRGWNADGMHHVDAHSLDSSEWIAAVDGKVLRKRFRWRRGVRAILNLIGLRKPRATNAL